MIKVICLLIFSYLIGSIPNAFWIGKVFKNIDIRQKGSGNVGATNAARVLGYKYGFMTLVLDVLKGAIPTYIGYKMGANLGIYAAICAIIGHSYSIFLKFKGGKAVATTVGIFLIISPYSILALLVVFFAIVFLTGYVSIASMVSALCLAVAVYLFKGTTPEIIFSIIIGLFVIYKHKSNIKNLINKKEAKFFDK